ncbi:MAG TPA: hypothetical protein VE779_17845, partial [Candidatus Angelobacter sp.]|nr:hypothetical protein [Candidatus Angelobacter sp.]
GTPNYFPAIPLLNQSITDAVIPFIPAKSHTCSIYVLRLIFRASSIRVIRAIHGCRGSFAYF